MDEAANMIDADADVAVIVRNILADADAESARMTAEAETYSVDVNARAQGQALTIDREAAVKAAEQARHIKSELESRAENERRKRSLRMQEALSVEVIDKAIKRLAAMVTSPEYRNVLRTWIAEAAIGLSAEAASVNASMVELPLIDDKLLRLVEGDVVAATGKAVTLRKVEGDPLVGQGVYLVAEDGRMAYDNRVATRLERQRSEIRKLIFKALFDGKSRGTAVTGKA